MKSVALSLNPPLAAPTFRVRRGLAEFQHERGRWPLWLPVLIGLGVWGYFALPFEPPRAALLATPVLAGLRVLLRRTWARLPLTLMLLLVLGVNAGQVASWRAAHPMLRHEFGPVQVTGRVAGINPKIEGVTLLLDALEIARLPPEETPRRVQIRLHGDHMSWPAVGSRIALKARLTPAREPAAPGAYDFRRHAFFNGIGAYGSAHGVPEILAAPAGNRFMEHVETVRAAIATRVLQLLSGDEAQIAVALLNGAQSGISQPALNAMRASGLQHILSISGLHLAIAAAFVFIGLRGLLALWPYAALRWPIKQIAAGLSLFSLLAYTLLVGAPVPAVRAAIMTGIVMLAVLFDRRALSLRTVALAATILLLAVPEALTGASFQMSFAAVTVMIAVYEAVRHYRRAHIGVTPGRSWGHNVMRHVGAIALTSVLASAATAPFTLYNFQQMNWYGIVANMLGIPLTTFWIMPAGFIAYFLMPFGLDGAAIQLMGSGIRGLMLIAETVGAWPGAMIRITAPPFWALPLMVFGGLWLCLWMRPWRLLGVLPLLLGVALCCLPHAPDMLIAPDFANWAVRDGDRYIAMKSSARDFTIVQWRQRAGGADFSARDPETDVPLRCDAMGCIYAAQDQRVALVTDVAALYEDCGQVGLIITPLWHVRCPEASGTRVIDGAWMKWHGALAIRLDPGMTPQVTTTRDRWGARPWSPGWKERTGSIRQTILAPASLGITDQVETE